jgi:hypothetical protein
MTSEYKRNSEKKINLKKNSNSNNNISKMINSKERLIKICLFKNNEPKSKEKIFINKNSNKNIFPLKEKFVYIDYSFINNKIDIHKYLEPTLKWLDYDEVIEEDKRSFCEYLGEKIINNQLIINILFTYEEIRPRSIKITILVLTIDLFLLINGLFYSDSYISEIFNSNEKETFFSFVPRSIDRFLYTTIVGSIIGYILQFSFVEEVKIKKILLKKRENVLTLRYEMSEILKEILKKIKIFIIFNYFIVIFSWYYLSCFNNVYPNTKREWIISSLFIIIIQEILPIILKIEENIVDVCKSQFSANVIEKCFENSENIIREHILDSLIKNYSDKIIDIFLDQYGIYVIQKALKLKDSIYRSKLIEIINDKEKILKNINFSDHKYKNVLKVINSHQELTEVFSKIININNDNDDKNQNNQNIEKNIDNNYNKKRNDNRNDHYHYNRGKNKRGRKYHKNSNNI